MGAVKTKEHSEQHNPQEWVWECSCGNVWTSFRTSETTAKEIIDAAKCPLRDRQGHGDRPIQGRAKVLPAWMGSSSE